MYSNMNAYLYFIYIHIHTHTHTHTSTLSEKRKLKRDGTTHLLEWPKSRTLTTPTAGVGIKQQELSFIVGGNAK